MKYDKLRVIGFWIAFVIPSLAVWTISGFSANIILRTFFITSVMSASVFAVALYNILNRIKELESKVDEA